MAQNKVPKHRSRQSRSRAPHYKLQYIRTAANKLRRINRERAKAGLSPLEVLNWRDKSGNLYAMTLKLSISMGKPK